MSLLTFLIVLSHKSYPPAHCPDLQRLQRPWEEAAEKTPVHPLAGVGYLSERLTQLQTKHACMGMALKTDLSQREDRSVHALQAFASPTLDHPHAIAQHILFKKGPRTSRGSRMGHSNLVT